MTKIPVIGIATVLGALVLNATGGLAVAYNGEKLASAHAKVTIEEARAIALKAHPGKMTDEELEREKGGSGYRYSFDIRDGAKTFEVGVDANTGKLLENAAEGPNPD